MARTDAGPVPHFCELAGRTADRRSAWTPCGPRAAAAETELIDLGVTFTVYSDATAIDRILPFDCIPRI
jgi:uncharacterized circularly permuted ATP-grasp superfamily protein